ncbi:MAG: glucosaminidase domain-containing protein [Clostridia bacterium]|nr:glucosaminidase domain-containing protein [Clostridia bacterium]
MNLRKTALLLAVVITAMTVITAVPAVKAEAATAAEVQYFLDTVGPMCTIDMRDNHILASVSVAQAIWESGWGTSTLAKQANNLFGIRAYSSWSGKVFDRNDCILYDNWAAVYAAKGEAYVKANTLVFWRGYNSWQESVNDHSALFNNMSIYARIRGNYDYKSVCNLLYECGYCGEPTYPDVLIKVIEQYDLEKYNYDFGTGNVGGGSTVGSVSLKPDSLYMEKGALYTLSITANGADYILTSGNAAVVAVSGSSIKAVNDGTAIITISAGGKSDTCTVTVKCGYGCIVADGVYVKCLATGNTASIPAEARTIKNGAFNGTSVTTIVVGSSVSSIEDGAFGGIGGLTLCGNSDAVQKYAEKNSISYVNVAGWTIDKYASIFSGVEAYTTAMVVNTYYGISGIKAAIVDSKGNVLSSTAYVGTGCKITVNGATYTVTVKGDTNGDGRTSTADLVTLKAYLAGGDDSLPERAFRRAADYNGDNRITTADYMAIFKEA